MLDPVFFHGPRVTTYPRRSPLRDGLTSGVALIAAMQIRRSLPVGSVPPNLYVPLSRNWYWNRGSARRASRSLYYDRMDSRQVIGLFEMFERHSFRAWAAGGWAVDALVGRQTRDHGDLDLAVDATQLDRLMCVLEEEGFSLSVDWLPSRAELRSADGRVIDLHPVRFAPDGTGVQSAFGDQSFPYAADGFTVGSIEGTPIPCLSAGQQLAFRSGYPLRPVDHHDLELLHAIAHA